MASMRFCAWISSWERNSRQSGGRQELRRRIAGFRRSRADARLVVWSDLLLRIFAQRGLLQAALCDAARRRRASRVGRTARVSGPDWYSKAGVPCGATVAALESGCVAANATIRFGWCERSLIGATRPALRRCCGLCLERTMMFVFHEARGARASGHAPLDGCFTQRGLRALLPQHSV